ncbi:hypothetical protein HYALB_00004175 [Hymenoscyphus albidus]|uniref:CENP-C homolog n=1 Tax=Hymenoscyphus albidus TaxID=595503 RepID=A0A9N9M2K1_9HELO|nr:hypothetical protein HYALB_00004175 [Hymenoscyphus albidus]
MAPNGNTAQPKRKKNENQYLFDLGVRGRKTGLTLPDTGIRDENGLEPMDGLFSSPEKSVKGKGKGKASNGYPNRTISSDEEMDMGSSTIPEPEDVLEQRASFRLPPRSNSPIKTFLKSPARKNPSFGGGVLSPNRGSTAPPRTASASVAASVRRKLDFSGNEEDSNQVAVGTNKRAKSVFPVASASRLNGATRLVPPARKDSVELELESREDDYSAASDDTKVLDAEDSIQMVDYEQDDEPEEDYEMVEAQQESEPESEPEPEVRPMKKGKRKVVTEEQEEEQEPEAEPQPSKKGKRKAASIEPSEEPAKKSRGRPKKIDAPAISEEEEDDIPRQAKRTRRSLDEAPEPVKKSKGRPKKAAAPEPQQEAERASESEPEQEPEEEEPEPEPVPQKKAGTKRKVSQPEPTKKAQGKPQKTVLNASRANVAKKSKLAAIPETRSPEVKRGPPLPRSNQGLMILRRENPLDGGAGFQRTRSGRNSIKPLAYWKNERVEYSDEETEDSYGKFMLPKIKEVVRADEVEPTRNARAASRSKSGQSKKRRVAIEEEDEEMSEPWEIEPGKIYGNVQEWDPADPTGAETDEREDEIALSNAAIITRDVGNSTFKFAKTHTLPFFGSGMVDLPPGAAKKPKNSRKMQMVFFVFYGRVKVTVNENEFRIGKGGLWQVPRGNFYSIENDYDSPARIFFAQGCEVSESADESQLR